MRSDVRRLNEELQKPMKEAAKFFHQLGEDTATLDLPDTGENLEKHMRELTQQCESWYKELATMRLSGKQDFVAQLAETKATQFRS